MVSPERYDFKGHRQGAFDYLKRCTRATDNHVNGTLNTAVNAPGNKIRIDPAHGNRGALVMLADDGRFEVWIL